MAILNLLGSVITAAPSTSSSKAGTFFTAEGKLNTAVVAVDSKNADAVETMNRLIYSASVLYTFAQDKRTAELAERATINGLTLPRTLTQILYMLTGNPRADKKVDALQMETFAGKMFSSCPSLHSRASKVNKRPFLSLVTPQANGSVQIAPNFFNVGKLNKSESGAQVGDSVAIALAIIGGEVDKTTLLTNSYKSVKINDKGWNSHVVDVERGKKINTVRDAHLRFAQSLPAVIPNLSTTKGQKAFQSWLETNKQFLENELRIQVKQA